MISVTHQADQPRAGAEPFVPLSGDYSFLPLERCASIVSRRDTRFTVRGSRNGRPRSISIGKSPR